MAEYKEESNGEKLEIKALGCFSKGSYSDVSDARECKAIYWTAADLDTYTHVLDAMDAMTAAAKCFGYEPDLAFAVVVEGGLLRDATSGNIHYPS